MKTGKKLERQVANAYRAMGARKVEHDVELAGHQIDVYVEMETADRALHRIAVEAKDYARPVGIEIVSGFAAVVSGLRTLKLIDEGVIISAAGFSRPARNAAQELCPLWAYIPPAHIEIRYLWGKSDPFLQPPCISKVAESPRCQG